MDVSHNKMVSNTVPLAKKHSSSQNNKIISKKSTIDHDDEEYYILHDVLKTIEALFEMRFIEHISRPIQKRTKQEIVEKFAGRMESLHNKLEKIRSQYAERNTVESTNHRQKSIYGSVTHHPVDWKKSIRAIETRYMEVFYQGSFKFYRKLYQLNHLTYPLRTIKIEEWAAFCLNKRDQQTCC